MVHENGSLIYENAEAEESESEDMQEEIKGIIHFPCCYKEKKVVFISGRGKVSDKCPRCGKIALFDLDRMNSRCYKPVRGATS